MPAGPLFRMLPFVLRSLVRCSVRVDGPPPAWIYRQPVGGQVYREGHVQLYTHDGSVHEGSAEAQ
jgi:hypothetical protein